MPSLTQGRQAAEFLMYENGVSFSRDNAVIVSGSGVLAAGTVLGKITASGKYKASTDTGADGAQVASAVLLYNVDATSADVPVAIISRNAEVNGKLIAYHSSVSDATKKAAKATQLAAVGIIVR